MHHWLTRKHGSHISAGRNLPNRIVDDRSNINVRRLTEKTQSKFQYNTLRVRHPVRISNVVKQYLSVMDKGRRRRCVSRTNKCSRIKHPDSYCYILVCLAINWEDAEDAVSLKLSGHRPLYSPFYQIVISSLGNDHFNLFTSGHDSKD